MIQILDAMRCMIIDDLPVARSGMRRLISRHSDLEIIGEYDNASDALKAIFEGDAELIFADIRMPGLSGLDLARILPQNIGIIFTTAFSEYAVDSFDLGVVDYLVKPIDPERFDRAVAKAREAYGNAGRSSILDSDRVLTVKSDRRFLRIRFEDILYLEGNKDLVIIHLADKDISTRTTLRALEELLPDSVFLRVNKSFIVNREKITAFDSSDVLIGKREIAIGPSYRDSVMNCLLP